MDPKELMGREDVRFLVAALRSMESDDEMAALLVDLCTPREIADFAQRLEVAWRLDSHEPYVKVQKATGASSTTVSRVSKFLNRGEGYRLVLDRLGDGPFAAKAQNPAGEKDVPSA